MSQPVVEKLREKVEITIHDLSIVLNILQGFVPEFEVWAYGSRVKGTAKRYSDIDLAIISDKRLPLARLGDIRDAFDESDLTISVDVVDWSAISEEFKEVVKKRYVVLRRPIR